MHWIFRVLGKVFPSQHGPRAYQLSDIRRTRMILSQTIGKEVLAWRDHSYIRDRHTYGLLAACGIRVVSDEVSPHAHRPSEVREALLTLPINTLPDHENVLHGKYRPGYTKEDRLAGRLTVEDWGERVRKEILEIEARGGIATVLAHPVCMDLADGMKVFEQICQFASGFRTVFVSEGGGYAGPQ